MKWSVVHCLSLIELWTLSSCLLHHYHFVNESKTWKDAQTFCRENYRDLATVTNLEENNQIVSIAENNSYREQAWIGLYNDVNSWRWSLRDSESHDQSKPMFYMWDSGQPDNYKGKEACALITSTGGWNDINCEEPLRAFICYENGTERFLIINNTGTWSDAQSYCREHHTDLARVRNQSENERVQNLVPSGSDAWIGLFRDAWKWSDGSKSTYSNWNVDEPNNGRHNEDCGEIWIDNGVWNDHACSTTSPFFCTVPVKRQIVRLKLQVNSTVDLSSTAVQVEILSQIGKKLQEKGLPADAKLSWSKQPDGQIFHKIEKRENRERKRRSKEEF